jgi:hypothetical protein
MMQLLFRVIWSKRLPYNCWKHMCDHESYSDWNIWNKFCAIRLTLWIWIIKIAKNSQISNKAQIQFILTIKILLRLSMSTQLPNLRFDDLIVKVKSHVKKSCSRQNITNIMIIFVSQRHQVRRLSLVRQVS